MIQLTLDEALQRKGVAEGVLRAAKGALEKERQLKSPYISDALAAVEDAQKRFDFNLRRVEQIREDELNAELARVSMMREAAAALTPKPKARKGAARGKRSKVEVVA
jgi:hypothetical protein